MKNMTWVAILTTIALAAGCSSKPGSRPSDTPPRLVERDNKLFWDRGENFGPVPLKLASVAAINCASLDTKDLSWTPEGFHPRAQDLNGKTFPGGGYYCKPRERSN